MIENSTPALIYLWRIAMAVVSLITITWLAFTISRKATSRKNDGDMVARLCVCGKFCQVPHICDGECNSTDWN